MTRCAEFECKYLMEIPPPCNRRMLCPFPPRAFLQDPHNSHFLVRSSAFRRKILHSNPRANLQTTPLDSKTQHPTRALASNFSGAAPTKSQLLENRESLNSFLSPR